MTKKNLIAALTELPQDVQLCGCILNVKNLKDFRRLILSCDAKAQINRSKFPDASGTDWIFGWFYTGDELIQFRWEGSVNGYEVRWCGHDGEEHIDRFRELEDAQMAAEKYAEDCEGVMLLPGADGVPKQKKSSKEETQ